MKHTVRAITVIAVAAVAAIATTGRTKASSHREALAILNEPCADNTDTFAWVSNQSHDKLYLIMDFNPLHEPGQGNQGLRACNGYRYEFHIATGKSLKDQVVYRVEFTNRLKPESAPSAADPLGGGNELLWQLTGGTETMKVTRITDDDSRHYRGDSDDDVDVLGKNLAVLPNNHGPQTDRLVYGLGPFKGYDSGDATSREVGLYDQPFVDTFIHTLSNGGRIIDREWVRLNLARVHAKVEYLKLLNWEIASGADAGGDASPKPWNASTCKVLGTELATDAYRTLMEVLGPQAYLRQDSAGAQLRGRLERMHRACLILTFGGGTNEVQRDIIAMTALKQPAAAR